MLLTGFRTDFASSVRNFCRWIADVPPRETSLSGDERGETSAVRRLTLVWYQPWWFKNYKLSGYLKGRQFRMCCWMYRHSMWNKVPGNCSCQILPPNWKKILSVHQLLGAFSRHAFIVEFDQVFCKNVFKYYIIVIKLHLSYYKLQQLCW